MDAQGPDVCACLAGDPEDHQVALGIILVELGAVDAPDAELALDCRDEGRPLEQRTCFTD